MQIFDLIYYLMETSGCAVARLTFRHAFVKLRGPRCAV
jgi:hypothetical protein